VAWRLPNSYDGCHSPGPKGRQKKINRQIDLVNQRAQGNDRPASAARVGGDGKPERLFFESGGAAAKAYNRAGHFDAFWPPAGRAEAGLWRVIAGQMEQG
jgi:hypothetical protein